MPLNVRNGEHVHTVGDSLTAGVIGDAWGAWLETPVAGLWQRMRDAAPPLLPPTIYPGSVGPTPVPGAVTTISGAGIASLRPVISTATTFTKMAQGGIGIDGLRTQLATYIDAFLPIDVLIIALSINDFIGGTPLGTAGDNSTSTFYGRYEYCLAYIKAKNPFVRVLCVGSLCWGETFTVSPNHLTGSGQVDTSVYDTAIAAMCAARPGWTEYCPMASAVLAYEIATFAPPGFYAANVGTTSNLTLDGLHPQNVAPGNGQFFMASQAMAHFTFSAT